MNKYCKFLVICICLALTSCERFIAQKYLIGTWSGYNGLSTMTVTFEPDYDLELNLYTDNDDVDYFEGTYTCTSSSFVLKIERQNNYRKELTLTYDYTMADDGESMTVCDVHGNTGVLRRY